MVGYPWPISKKTSGKSNDTTFNGETREKRAGQIGTGGEKLTAKGREGKIGWAFGRRDRRSLQKQNSSSGAQGRARSPMRIPVRQYSDPRASRRRVQDNKQNDPAPKQGKVSEAPSSFQTGRFGGKTNKGREATYQRAGSRGGGGGKGSTLPRKRLGVQVGGQEESTCCGTTTPECRVKERGEERSKIGKKTWSAQTQKGCPGQQKKKPQTVKVLWGGPQPTQIQKPPCTEAEKPEEIKKKPRARSWDLASPKRTRQNHKKNHQAPYW